MPQRKTPSVFPSTKKASVSAKRIAWSQLKDFFEGQWVELVDYKWDWNQAAPTWATVRYHAAERAELLAMIRKSGEVSGSVVLFIGNIRSTFEHSLSAAV